jgi:ATP-dependent exoDNAse (exonuclease V) beta subunit
VGSRIGEYKEVLSEFKLYDHDYELAGTADLVFCHKNNTFTIGDFKTNKKFNFTSKYNENLLYPIDHLHNCEFNVYALQLSIYAYMYEKLTGNKCRGLVIFYLENGKWAPVSCNYLKNDVVAILSDYKEKCSLKA